MTQSDPDGSRGRQRASARPARTTATPESAVGAALPMARIDARLAFASVNRALAKVLGRRPLSLLGKSCAASFPLADIQAALRRVLDRGQAQRLYGRPCGGPDPAGGPPRSWDWIMTPLKARPGAGGGLVLCLVEVTHHTQTEQALRAELCRLEERSRRRLAKAVHDQAAQTLAAAKLMLQMQGEHLTNPEAEQRQRQALALIAQAGEQLRALSADLSPTVLYEVGLAPALEALTTRIGKQYALPTGCELRGPWQSLPEALRVFLFHAARELLDNAGRHAKAKRIDLALAVEPGQVSLAVNDDGRGFDPATLETPGPDAADNGLLGLRERLRHLGGSLELQSARGQGTTVTLTAPFDPVPQL